MTEESGFIVQALLVYTDPGSFAEVQTEIVTFTMRRLLCGTAKSVVSKNRSSSLENWHIGEHDDIMGWGDGSAGEEPTEQAQRHEFTSPTPIKTQAR